MRANDTNNAIKEYVRAADLFPTTPTRKSRRAGAARCGPLRGSQARADKALERDPKKQQAQILRGNALAGLKDFDGADRGIRGRCRCRSVAARGVRQSGHRTATQRQPGRSRGGISQGHRSSTSIGGGAAVARQLLLGRPATRRRRSNAQAGPRRLTQRTLTANRALAVFYMATGRGAEAEPYFRGSRYGR